MNRLDNVLNDILWSIFGDYGADNLAINEAIEEIQAVYAAEGYEKKSHILYGTKYPDPRPCTKNSHFIEHEQSDCSCGYTEGMK